MKTNRGNTHLHLYHALALIPLAIMLWAGTPAIGQGTPSASPPVSGDRDITREELANMDRFLDRHPEIAEQLRKDPTLINNQQWLASHPQLQEFLETHPGVREEFRENPAAFMQAEQRFDQLEARFGDRDMTRGELANMDRFLDSHPEIAEQLRKDPTLINNQQWVQSHPQLREFLQQHPGVREEFSENPVGFMQAEQRFDRHEDDRDPAAFGRFLSDHSVIAEQLSKDPSLVNNKEFMASHPELQEFLQSHPAVTAELTKNPQAFMSSLPPTTAPPATTPPAATTPATTTTTPDPSAAPTSTTPATAPLPATTKPPATRQMPPPSPKPPGQ